MSATSWDWTNLHEAEPEDEEHDHALNNSEEEEEAEPRPEEEDSPPEPPRHYPPRTCRICFDEVLPSFDIPLGGIPSMLHPKPRVRYISDDPDAGRLIRPCKCRGTQQYVHEGCLQQWRHSDSSYKARTYWECPTCKFKYNLERMKWSRWLSSTFLQIAITTAIMFSTIFIFGFIADPIFNLWLDPYETITSLPSRGMSGLLERDDTSWAEHFLKGFASLGLLGFTQVFFAMSPWQRWNLRGGGGGGRRATRGRTGRDRLEDISWVVVIIGVVTFLLTIWSWVRAWATRTLEIAGHRVLDVQGDDDDDDLEYTDEPVAKQESFTGAPTEEVPTTDAPQTTVDENRKTQ